MKNTFLKSKIKHLKISFYLIRGALYLLTTVRFRKRSEGMKIVSSFGDSPEVKEFLFSLTNLWQAQEVLLSLGVNQKEIQNLTSEDDDEKLIKKSEKILSHLPKQETEETTYLNVLQKASPMDYAKLVSFKGDKEKN